MCRSFEWKRHYWQNKQRHCITLGWMQTDIQFQPYYQVVVMLLGFLKVMLLFLTVITLFEKYINLSFGGKFSQHSKRTFWFPAFPLAYFSASHVFNSVSLREAKGWSLSTITTVKCPLFIVLALVGSNWLRLKCSDVLVSGSQPLIRKPQEISAALHVKNPYMEGNCSVYIMWYICWKMT